MLVRRRELKVAHIKLVVNILKLEVTHIVLEVKHIVLEVTHIVLEVTHIVLVASILKLMGLRKDHLKEAVLNQKLVADLKVEFHMVHLKAVEETNHTNQVVVTLKYLFSNNNNKIKNFNIK